MNQKFRFTAEPRSALCLLSMALMLLSAAARLWYYLADPVATAMTLSQADIFLLVGLPVFSAALYPVLLALFGLLGQTRLHAMNGMKNLVSALLTAIAVAIYAAGGVVQWEQALVMMIAATAGGYGGARLARRIPPEWLRAGIVLTGLVMAGVFFWR